MADVVWMERAVGQTTAWEIEYENEGAPSTLRDLNTATLGTGSLVDGDGEPFAHDMAGKGTYTGKGTSSNNFV